MVGSRGGSWVMGWRACRGFRRGGRGSEWACGDEILPLPAFQSRFTERIHGRGDSGTDGAIGEEGERGLSRLSLGSCYVLTPLSERSAEEKGVEGHLLVLDEGLCRHPGNAFPPARRNVNLQAGT